MMRAILIAAALLALAPHGLAAQRGRAEVEAGNRLYRDARFDEAHQRYLDALREAPGSDLIRFNDGNALYKTDDYDRAVEAYRAAAQSGDPALQARAWYNLGNALFRQQELEGAAEAYREALRLDPADGDAKHNLERVLQIQQQQQQQQQQPNDQQQNDESQEQDQQQQQEQSDQQRQQDQSQQQPQDASNQDQQPQQRPRDAQTQMTPEEAQRLLRAIQEDPGKIQRQRSTTAARRRPRREW